jgi:hypothetical protein
LFLFIHSASQPDIQTKCLKLNLFHFNRNEIRYFILSAFLLAVVVCWNISICFFHDTHNRVEIQKTKNHNRNRNVSAIKGCIFNTCVDVYLENPWFLSHLFRFLPQFRKIFFAVSSCAHRYIARYESKRCYHIITIIIEIEENFLFCSLLLFDYLMPLAAQIEHKNISLFKMLMLRALCESFFYAAHTLFSSVVVLFCFVVKVYTLQLVSYFFCRHFFFTKRFAARKKTICCLHRKYVFSPIKWNSSANANAHKLQLRFHIHTYLMLWQVN